ncbi:MAG: transposase, partial [Candidatus Lokiarchaeota archaeon]
FLDRIDDIDLYYLGEVAHTTRVWLERPATEVPPWKGRGPKPTKERIVEGEEPSQEVATIAKSLPAGEWTRQFIKEGSKGPMVADFAALRVVAVRDRMPGPEVWLVLRRNVSDGELKCYLSNAPEDTPLSEFARLSGMRWPIETCFEDGKQQLGMGDYQLRSWRGWHHQMTLCILAHFFLVRLKLRLGDQAPALTLPQTQLLLASDHCLKYCLSQKGISTVIPGVKSIQEMEQILLYNQLSETRKDYIPFLKKYFEME